MMRLYTSDHQDYWLMGLCLDWRSWDETGRWRIELLMGPWAVGVELGRG